MIDVAMEAKDFDSGACFGGNRAAAVPVVAAKPAASKFRLHSAYKTPITTVPLQPSNKPAPSVNRQPVNILRQSTMYWLRISSKTI